jgi:glucosamine--fructose-6-phosphate aminotransferase (isomerizing)
MKLPVVVLAAYDPHDEASRLRYEKTLSNLQEVKAREGIVIAIRNEGDEDVEKLATYSIALPWSYDMLLPLLRLCCSSYWLITLRCGGGATWTSRGTWPSR